MCLAALAPARMPLMHSEHVQHIMASHGAHWQQHGQRHFPGITVRRAAQRRLTSAYLSGHVVPDAVHGARPIEWPGAQPSQRAAGQLRQHVHPGLQGSTNKVGEVHLASHEGTWHLPAHQVLQTRVTKPSIVQCATTTLQGADMHHRCYACAPASLHPPLPAAVAPDSDGRTLRACWHLLY